MKHYFLGLIVGTTLSCLGFWAYQSLSDSPDYRGQPSSRQTEIVHLLEKTGVQLCPVAATGSMLPTLDEGSTLILSTQFNQTSLVVGDIVLYDSPEYKNIVHRIIDINGDRYYLKGDNNKIPDGWIDYAQITHVVIGIIYGK
jgi:signal peptidase I